MTNITMFDLLKSKIFLIVQHDFGFEVVLSYLYDAHTSMQKLFDIMGKDIIDINEILTITLETTPVISNGSYC